MILARTRRNQLTLYITNFKTCNKFSWTTCIKYPLQIANLIYSQIIIGITLNKRKKIILFREMKSRKNLLNPTPNTQSIRAFKK